MLRALRQHLRRIQYYSASPVRTVWTRAMDIALFAALVLALPIALLSEMLVVRHATAWEQHGRLIREDGRIVALLIEPELVSAPWGQSRPYGTFEVSVPRHDAGLPLVSVRRPLPMKVELDLFTEPNLDPAAALAKGAPVYAAIDAAVRIGGDNDLRAAWRGDRPPTRRLWGAMAMNTVLWWFALYVAASITIVLVRFGWAVVSRRQAARKRYWRTIGRCAACGYDLRGLEFSARCPECGEPV